MQSSYLLQLSLIWPPETLPLPCTLRKPSSAASAQHLL